MSDFWKACHTAKTFYTIYTVNPNPLKKYNKK